MVAYRDIVAFVRDRVTEAVYAHCTATAETAADLANHHGIDSRRARDAALLHDVARSLDDAALIKEAERFGIAPSLIERQAPVLLHARVGAKMVEQELGVTDSETVAAIVAHTTGARHMHVMARLVFVADYAEPSRNLPGADEVRALLPERLDEALLSVVRRKIAHVMQSGGVVAPASIELWNELAQTLSGTAGQTS
jgi:predicted HD superfamily hydrolase involved in NAD metabolism